MLPDEGWNPAGAPVFAPASRLRRFFAYLFDSFIVGIPSVIVAALIMFASIEDFRGLFIEQADGSFDFRPGGEAEFTRALQYAAVAVLIIQFGYFVCLTAMGGQTLAKRWLGIEVIRLADGASPSITDATVRYLFIIGPGAFLLGADAAGMSLGVWQTVFVLAPWAFAFWAFIDPAQRGIHDIVGGTVVVQDGYVRMPAMGDRSRYGGGPLDTW